MMQIVQRGCLAAKQPERCFVPGKLRKQDLDRDVSPVWTVCPL